MVWLLSLWSNPLVKKFAAYAAITLVVLYCIRLYGNGQWSKGEQKGRVSSTQMIEKVKKEEWKKVEATLKQQEESINEYKRSLAAERVTNDELIKQATVTRTELKTSLKTGLSDIKTEIGRDHETVCAIPASELISAIRVLSNELRTAH